MGTAFRGGFFAAALAMLPLSPAAADSIADFYKGKNVDMYIGYSAGGGYDVYARLVARHIGKHIPGNPTVVPKNMTGAGSLKLANWLFAVAPKDGSAMGMIGRGTGFDPLFGIKGAQFKGTQFNWLGSANDEVSVCVSWHTSDVKKFEDLHTRELIVGGTGASADTDQFPRIMNAVLGTRMRVISGYPGGNDIGLALERGEVKGRCGWSWSSVKVTHQKWLDEKKINILIQLSLGKHPDLPDVPVVVDLAKTPDDKAIMRLLFARQVMGRPFLAPPGVPADRLAGLRKAFMDTMRDKEFLADAEKGRLEITPVSGEDIQKLVEDVYATPAAVTQRATELLQVEKK